jgi:hypothetical protein
VLLAKQRSLGIFSRNTRREQQAESIIEDEDDSESEEQNEETIKATVAFLREMNGSWDQHDNPVACIQDDADEMDETKGTEDTPLPPTVLEADEIDKTQGTEDTPSLLDTAWKLLSFQPERKSRDTNTEPPSRYVLQDTHRIFGIPLPSLPVDIEETRVGNETKEIDDTQNEGDQEFPAQKEEDVGTSTGEEVCLSFAEIASALTPKNKKRGLLLRRERKSKVEKEKDDLVSLFVPIVDDEGVQMIVAENSTSGPFPVEKKKKSNKKNGLFRIRRKGRKEICDEKAEPTRSEPEATLYDEAGKV